MASNHIVTTVSRGAATIMASSDKDNGLTVVVDEMGMISRLSWNPGTPKVMFANLLEAVAKAMKELE